VSSKQRGAFYLASYLNHASRLNITHEKADRLFNAYQTDLSRKIDFVDEVGLCIYTSDKLDSHASPIVDLK
jgi:hypothetical protein